MINWFRLQVALQQHFTGLKEHLMVALMSLGREGCEGERGGVEKMVEEVGSVGDIGGVDRMMKVLYKCLERLCKARVCSTTETPASQSDNVSD